MSVLPNSILNMVAKVLAQHWWFLVLLLLILIPMSHYDFLLFHTLVEIFSIIIAAMCAIVAWHTYSLSRSHFLLLLGCGYFFVGALDLAHTLTFEGFPFITEGAGNTTLQFWILARFFEATLLLLAPLFIRIPIHPVKLVLSLGVGFLFLVWAILDNVIPVLYVEGEGLTLTKVISEYLIIALLLGALATLSKQKENIELTSYWLLVFSILCTIAAEVCFTLYNSLSDFAITTGHILKLISYWAIYISLIDTSLRRPFLNLARDANTYDAVPDETLVVERSGIIRQVNRAIRNNASLARFEDVIGTDCHEVQHSPEVKKKDCLICQSIDQGLPLSGHEFYDADLRHWYEVSLSAIGHGKSSLAMVHVRRNITERMAAKQRSELFNRLYTVLSHTNRVLASAKSRQQMFEDICEIAVKHGGFKMSWIGLISNNLVKPQAHAGDEAGYLTEIEVRVDDTYLSRGPVGKAAKTNQVQCINELSLSEDFAPWLVATESSGFEAIAAVPLNLNNKTVGIYAIYSTQKNVFDDKMMSLLASLGRDISAAMERLQERKNQEYAEHKIHQLSQVVEQNSHAILITDTNFKIEYANRAFTVLTGYLLQELVGKTPAILRSQYEANETYRKIGRTLRSGQRWSGQVRHQRKDGSLYWALQTITPIKSDTGDVTHYVSTSEDNTELHDAQETIEQLAFYDPLTNLPNRRLLSDRLQQAIDHAQRSPDEMVAVMVFDLDNFKTVNDSLGHNYGDELLRQVATIFQSQIRKEDTVSRQGGDEFTIILSGMKDTRKVVDIATGILSKLSEPINISGHQVVIGSSIGIAMYPADAEDREGLLRNADLAMYHAKDEGKNNFQFFMPAMNKQAHQRLVLENKLRHAIEQKHFQLFYQPQMDLDTGEIIGTEALIRWIDPEQGMMSPADFIPLAEDTGLIGQIGDWVIETACRDMKALHEQGFPLVKVAVNVSAFQFRHGKHLTEVIRNALDKYEYPADLFSLELTESILIDDINETLSVLNSMRELGIVLAIDDFGTGYSSLSYLKQFPIDILKIDQSFIRDIITDTSDRAIVSAIIAMAKQLGIAVLAEGVEELQHQVFLKAQGCDYVQGYLYCKPIPADELLQRWQSLTLA